ncbi:FGGY-family carbohydrate kinase [Enterovibrio nigricans]|nr:FGGY-family carbohydrate kinase [Enterovibrio nigricans]
MNNAVIIGVDAGTSMIKAVAFDHQGTVLATASHPNPYVSHANGHVEQDMLETWQVTADVISSLVEGNPEIRDRVIGLGITAQGDGTWLVDRDGVPVGPALLWLDSRASEIAQAISEGPDYDTLFSLTGTGVNACQQSCQLRWLQQHEPERVALAASAFHAKDWLYYCLTGVRAADPSEAVFTFGNFRTRNYEQEVLRILKLESLQHLLPPIVDGLEDAYPLTQDAAKRCGLPMGIPVTLGYVDVMCTALGGGLYDGHCTQSGCSIVGTTGMHIRLLPDAKAVRLSEEKTGYIMCFPEKGMLAQMQSNMSATLNIDWILDMVITVCNDLGVTLDRQALLKLIDDHPPANAECVLFHPYISNAGERGPFLDPKARASFSGLDIHHSYYHLFLAVLEGLAFATWDCYRAMGDLPNEVRITGGAAHSQRFISLLASVLNRPIRRIDQQEAGAAGVAMMVAVKVGLYNDMASAAESWVKPRLLSSVQPDASLVHVYQSKRDLYLQTRTYFSPVWAAFGHQKRSPS